MLKKITFLTLALIAGLPSSSQASDSLPTWAKVTGVLTLVAGAGYIGYKAGAQSREEEVTNNKCTAFLLAGMYFPHIEADKANTQTPLAIRQVLASKQLTVKEIDHSMEKVEPTFAKSSNQNTSNLCFFAMNRGQFLVKKQ